MNSAQALQVLTNLSNLCVSKGGILTTINEASMVNTALMTLNNMLDDYNNLLSVDESKNEKKLDK